jgi:hypothetical protein
MFSIEGTFMLLLSNFTFVAGRSPDFKWCGFQMPGTGIRSNPNIDHSSVFGGSLYCRIYTQYLEFKP